MEMRAAERSKAPLHNFDMPWLKWGSRRVMRCMKVDDNANDGCQFQAQPPPPTSFDHRRSIPIGRSRDSELQRRGSTPFFKTKDGGIDAVREELMLDLQTAADKMKDAFLREGLVESPAPAPATGTASGGGAAEEMEALRPWNLRIRRAACKEPGNGGGGGGGVRIQAEAAKSQRLLRVVGGGGAAAASGEKRARAKFSVALSRQEIEDDFMIMTARRLPRRPKKRPRIIQKNLDAIFPGSWLTEISADFYKVADAPETNGKR